METESHRSTVRSADIARIVGLPLAVLAGICVLLRSAGFAGLLPDPLPALDMDRTIILHQAAASEERHDAEIVLVGDSSCLMDVSAVGLSGRLGVKVVNLGTLSYLDITEFARILEKYFEAGNGPPRLVILVVHPDWLRRFESEPYHADVLDAFYERREACFSAGAFSRFACLSGIESLRSRVLARVLPVPLQGAARDYYGFTRDLWRFLDDRGGSAIDPGRFDPETPQGNAEFRISASLRRDGHLLKDVLPPGARLAISLTPTPERVVGTDFRPRWKSLLVELADVTGADVVLKDLPGSMVDSRFASRTHLAEDAVDEYSDRMAVSIQSVIQAP